MMDLKEIGQRAKDASYILGTMDSQSFQDAGRRS